MFLILGCVFIVFGIAMFLWARSERLAYRDKLTRMRDMREFMTNWPPRWWVNSLNIGGVIAVPIGIILLIMGLVFRS